MDLESWAGSIDLTTRAAHLLQKLVAALPQDREFTITVFESAPIQICVDASLTSADVDVFSDFEELVKELQLAVDLFRPPFDEEMGTDMANNCRRLWPMIYGHEIDPRTEIIALALAIRKAGYGETTRDYKQELRDALKA